MNSYEMTTTMDRQPVYPTSPSLLPSYSYLNSLHDARLGFRRQAEANAPISPIEDHHVELSLPGAVPAPEIAPESANGQHVEARASTPGALNVGGLLSDEEYAKAINEQYDPFWMVKHDISPMVHSGFTSKMKLEKLFKDGALLIGDKFCLTHVAHNGAEMVVEASVLSIGGSARPAGSRTSKYYPDFQVPPSPHHAAYTLWGCKGPTDFSAAMAVHYGINIPSGAASGFKAINVLRDVPGQGLRDLGTLHSIRQAFALWQDELEAWSVRTNQTQRTRIRRAPRDSGTQYVKGVLVEKDPGERVEDQLGPMSNRDILKRPRPQ